MGGGGQGEEQTAAAQCVPLQQLQQCHSSTELADCVRSHVEKFGKCELAEAFKQMSFHGVGSKSRQLEDCIAAVTARAVETKDFSPEQITQIFLAHAKLRSAVDEKLLQNLTQQAARSAPNFRTSEISNTLSAMSKLRIKPDQKLLSAFSDKAKTSASEFTPQAVANTLSALAALGVQADRELVNQLSQRATTAAAAFRPKDASRTFAALATMGVEADASLVEALGKRTAADSQDAACSDLVNSLWSLAKMKEKPDLAVVRDLCQQVLAAAPMFSPQEVSNSLWALAKLGANDTKLIRTLSARATAAVAEFRAQDVSTSLWALATLGVQPDASPRGTRKLRTSRSEKNLEFDRSASAVAPVRASFPQQSARTLSRAASVMSLRTSTAAITSASAAFSPGWAISTLLRRARALARRFTPDDVADTLWAMGKMNVQDHALTVEVIERARVTAGKFRPQHISASLWGLATLGVTDKALVDLLCARMAAALAAAGPSAEGPRLDGGVAVDTLWALASMGVEAETKVVEALSAQATLAAATLSPSHLTNLLWALAALAPGLDTNRRVVDALRQAARGSAERFEVREVVRCVGAMARMGVRNPDQQLVQALGDRVVGAAKELSAREVSETLRALATMGAMHTELVKQLCRRTYALLAGCSAQDTASALWALASMGMNAERKLMRQQLRAEDARLMHALGERAKAQAPEFSGQQLAEALWALATMGHEDKSVAEALSAAAAARAQELTAPQAADAMWGLHLAELPPSKRILQAYMGQAATPAPDHGVVADGLYAQRLPSLARTRSSSSVASRAPSALSVALPRAVAERTAKEEVLSRASSVDSARSTVPQLAMQQLPKPSATRLPAVKLKAVGETVFAR